MIDFRSHSLRFQSINTAPTIGYIQSSAIEKMSYSGESSVEARERQQREQEAEAFLTSLTPSLVAGSGPASKKGSSAGAQNGLEFHFSFNNA